MGQRLVITLTDMGKDLAKIYYHWSAYSSSALQEADNLVNSLHSTGFFDAKDENEKILSILKAVEENGGGLSGGEDGDEFAYVSKMFSDYKIKTDGYGRNSGLVAFTEKGMQDLQDWSEGDLTIDFDSGMVYNYVFNEVTDNDLADWYDMTDIEIAKLPEYDINISCFDLNDLPTVTDMVLNTLPDVYKYKNRYIALIV